MIMRLRSHRWHSVRYYPYRPHSERFWTDEDIMEALQLSPDRFESCLKANQTRKWGSREAVEKSIHEFIRRNKRWPTYADTRAKGSTLPYSDSINYWVTRRTWGQGLQQVINEYATRNWKKLTPEMVMTIPNLTIRREVIDKMGIGKLLSAAEQIQQDDFGTLWKFPYRDGRDAHMMYVEVINSTPNEKGVYDHYFLRVPPTTTSARAGVAWTFDKPTRGFKFAAQS